MINTFPSCTRNKAALAKGFVKCTLFKAALTAAASCPRSDAPFAEDAQTPEQPAERFSKTMAEVPVSAVYNIVNYDYNIHDDAVDTADDYQSGIFCTLTVQVSRKLRI